MPSAKNTYHPELPFFESINNSKSERSRDSEGRFTTDVEYRDDNERKEAEKRRKQSLYRMLRIKDEEILKLKEEIKKLRS